LFTLPIDKNQNILTSIFDAVDVKSDKWKNWRSFFLEAEGNLQFSFNMAYNSSYSDDKSMMWGAIDKVDY
jgi:hypothetical protein